MKKNVLFLTVFLSAHFFTNAQILPKPIASPVQAINPVVQFWQILVYEVASG